jgi:lipopolysaccharide transport system permease protein
MPPLPDDMPVVRFGASSGWSPLHLGELWTYRELIYFLLWRDIKVRYKQTILGASWAILQPLTATVVFTIFFGRIAKLPSEGIAYPVFAYTALVPWMFFANGVNRGANSLIGSVNLIKKVYFPRLLVPIAAVLSGALDFLVAFVILTGMILVYGHALSFKMVWLPLFLLLAVVTCLGTSLWFAALSVEYRDATYVVPFMIQIWLFATPVVYPSSMLPERWRTLYAANPMVSVVDGFRWALVGTTAPRRMDMLVSVAIAMVVVVTGMFYFRRAERNFADLI